MRRRRSPRFFPLSYESQQHRSNGLSLVVAAIVLWDTVYLEKAIRKLGGVLLRKNTWSRAS